MRKITVKKDEKKVTPEYLEHLVDYLADYPRWMNQASCRDTNGGHEEILSLCPSCPVREQCQYHAEKHGIDTGVWGGKLL